MGDTVKIQISALGLDQAVLFPFRSMKWLMGFYAVLFFASFIVWIYGTILFQTAGFCTGTAPTLYQYSQLLIIIYWVTFFVIVLYIVKLFCGSDITKIAKELTRTSTVEEIQSQLFQKKFNEIDKEGTRVISHDDVPKLLQALGVFVPEEETKSLIASFDPEETGQVEYKVMESWFKNLIGQDDDGEDDDDENDDDDDDDDDNNGKSARYASSKKK